MNSYNYDDEEALDMVLAFEVASDSETTDDSAEEDESEIEDANGDTTDDENNDDAENEFGLGCLSHYHRVEEKMLVMKNG